LAVPPAAALYRASGLVLWPKAAVIGIHAAWQLSGDKLPSLGTAHDG
jgi:hypothetical protein